jgi:molybdopterin molybdotransferase
MRPGDDLGRGDVVIPRGRRLRPQEIGALAALGVLSVRVHRRPIVGILATGNELVPADRTPRPGQVRDVNSAAQAAQARRAGAEVVVGGIVPDDAALLAERTAALLDRCDCVLLSGGSSIGTRDLTADVLTGLGAEILFHGVNVRPGKPTILARHGGRPLLGLPGVPVSAQIIFDAFVRPLLWRLGGEGARAPWPARVPAKMARGMPSVAGREDYVRVRLGPDGRAEPLLGGNAALSSLVRADGLVIVPAASAGLAAGEPVDVLLYT